MKARNFVLSVMCCVAYSGISGCTAVQPWERGNFAKPHMALDPDPLGSALSEHNYSSREGAAAGSSAGGGGCGCY
jgi:hypothetical protein